MMWAFCGTRWTGIINCHHFAFSGRHSGTKNVRENERGRDLNAERVVLTRNTFLSNSSDLCGENSVSHAVFSLPASGVGRGKAIVSSHSLFQ